MRCLGPDVSKDDDDPAAAPVAPDFEQTNAGADIAAARKKVTDLASALARLNVHGLPLQIAQHLFRVGSTNLIQHILAAKRVFPEAVAAYDANLRQAWQSLLGIPISDSAWLRGCMPVREGGVSFGAIGPKAPAAFVSSWSQTWQHVARHHHVCPPAHPLYVLILRHKPRFK